MSLLPNFERAVIDLLKLSEYVLNPDHPRGKDKAIMFKKVLGLDNSHADLLKIEILRQLGYYEAAIGEATEFGTKYTVLMKISIFGKEANLMTVWLIEKNKNFPRLITCYLLNRYE